jgi:DivIVA domain-containing protein
VPLTPAEIHNTEFGKASLGRRGYDEEQVDALLDEVTSEMIRLLEDNDLLQRRLDSADAVAGRSAAAGGAAALPAITAELSVVTAELDRARRECDQATRTARLVRQQLDEARRDATAEAATAEAATGRRTQEPPPVVLGMAKRTADNYLHQADEQSGALLADARERAGRLVDEAYRRVSDIEQSARRGQSDAEADLVAKRTAMLHQIDGLTQLAEKYRAALGDHLARQGQLAEGGAPPTAG